MLAKNTHLTINWGLSKNRQINFVLYRPDVNSYFLKEIVNFGWASTIATLCGVSALFNRKHKALRYHGSLSVLKINLVLFALRIVQRFEIWTKHRKSFP